MHRLFAKSAFVLCAVAIVTAANSQDYDTQRRTDEWNAREQQMQQDYQQHQLQQEIERQRRQIEDQRRAMQREIDRQKREMNDQRGELDSMRLDQERRQSDLQSQQRQLQEEMENQRRLCDESKPQKPIEIDCRNKAERDFAYNYVKTGGTVHCIEYVESKATVNSETKGADFNEKFKSCLTTCVRLGSPENQCVPYCQKQ